MYQRIIIPCLLLSALLLAIFSGGCGGGAPIAVEDTRMHGNLVVQLDWPRSRIVPLATHHIRIDLIDGLGNVQTASVTRPAAPAEITTSTFSKVFQGSDGVRITVIAFNASEATGYPIAWGTNRATFTTMGETITANILLTNPIAWDGDMAGLPTKPRLVTGTLVQGANATPVAGGWSWDAPLKDPDGVDLTDPLGVDWTAGRAFTIVAAGGRFYTYYFPGTQNPVQVPMIPDWVPAWDQASLALSRQIAQEEVPPFQSHYVTVTPGTPLTPVSLGVIPLTPGTPGGAADIEIQ